MEWEKSFLFGVCWKRIEDICSVCFKSILLSIFFGVVADSGGHYWIFMEIVSISWNIF